MIDTREDLPGAVEFEMSYGDQAKIWIHPSAVGAVGEERYGDNLIDGVSVIYFRAGGKFIVEGDTKETMRKLGWEA